MHTDTPETPQWAVDAATELLTVGNAEPKQNGHPRAHCEFVGTWPMGSNPVKVLATLIARHAPKSPTHPIHDNCYDAERQTVKLERQRDALAEALREIMHKIERKNYKPGCYVGSIAIARAALADLEKGGAA